MRKGTDMYETKWAQPNPADIQEPEGPPLPDTESLLAEVGASYPIVTYPAPAIEESAERDEERVEETIFAGLVWP
jgi:hypothetical protein